MNFLELIDQRILIFLAFIVSFFISYISIPTVIRMSRFKNLFDTINDRKVHTENIPRLGGIAIFAGLLITSLIFYNSNEVSNFGGFAAGLIILFFVGLKDDIIVISPITKLIGQIVAALVCVIFGGALITDFHGFFGINHIHFTLGIIISVLAFLITINAFNFIDGIDGLASSLGAIAALAFGIWFLLIQQYFLSLICFVFVASVIAFIRFNLFSKESKIFLGDTGSMIIGFFLTFVAIKFNEMNLVLDSTNPYFILPAPAVTLGIMIIPYFDMVRIIFIRLIRKKPVFYPDNNHIHHIFLSLGFSHKAITLFMSLFTICFITLVFWLSKFVTIRRLFLIELIIVLFLSFIPEYFKLKRNKKK